MTEVLLRLGHVSWCLITNWLTKVNVFGSHSLLLVVEYFPNTRKVIFCLSFLCVDALVGTNVNLGQDSVSSGVPCVVRLAYY